MSDATLVFQPEGKRARGAVGSTILEAAKSVGIDIESPCGNRGTCGKCRAVVREGRQCLSEPSALEARALTVQDRESGYRLACITAIMRTGTIVVEVPNESRLARQRLLVAGIQPPVELCPALTKLFISMTRPTLTDVRSDSQRLLDALAAQHNVRADLAYEAVKELAEAVRQQDWKVTLTVYKEREVTWVEPGDATTSAYGFAVDIGTTKVAGYLLDLNKGAVVATSSMMNPQIPYGDDVITRISFTSKEPRNLWTLHRLIVEGINKLVREACRSAGIDPRHVHEMVTVGNTAMHHIFLNISPKYVAMAPYPDCLGSAIDVRASELGVEINPGAYVHSLPSVVGFVGADAIADIIATEIYKAKEPSLLIDVGTNAEIVLGSEDGLLACSAPSGPAWEGMQIRHGMRASTGAIEKLWIDHESLEPSYKTVDDARPTGICGSGIVDAVAEMLKAGIIDRRGAVVNGLRTGRIRRLEGVSEYVLARTNETGTGKDIVITQKDIREIQLAKAAIYTGAYVLMKRQGVTPSKIGKFYLAGAFGNYIDLQSARVIGLYPDVSLDRVRFVGNAAGAGARMALLSTRIRDLARELASKVEYVQLAAYPGFREEFIKATLLPHEDLSRFEDVRGLVTGD